MPPNQFREPPSSKISRKTYSLSIPLVSCQIIHDGDSDQNDDDNKLIQNQSSHNYNRKHDCDYSFHLKKASLLSAEEKNKVLQYCSSQSCSHHNANFRTIVALQSKHRQPTNSRIAGKSKLQLIRQQIRKKELLSNKKPVSLCKDSKQLQKRHLFSRKNIIKQQANQYLRNLERSFVAQTNLNRSITEPQSTDFYDDQFTQSRKHTQQGQKQELRMSRAEQRGQRIVDEGCFAFNKYCHENPLGISHRQVEFDHQNSHQNQRKPPLGQSPKGRKSTESNKAEELVLAKKKKMSLINASKSIMVQRVINLKKSFNDDCCSNKHSRQKPNSKGSDNQSRIFQFREKAQRNQQTELPRGSKESAFSTQSRARINHFVKIEELLLDTPTKQQSNSAIAEQNESTGIIKDQHSGKGQFLENRDLFLTSSPEKTVSHQKEAQQTAARGSKSAQSTVFVLNYQCQPSQSCPRRKQEAKHLRAKYLHPKEIEHSSSASKRQKTDMKKNHTESHGQHLSFPGEEPDEKISRNKFSSTTKTLLKNAIDRKRFLSNCKGKRVEEVPPLGFIDIEKKIPIVLNRKRKSQSHIKSLSLCEKPRRSKFKEELSDEVYQKQKSIKKFAVEAVDSLDGWNTNADQQYF